MPLFGPTLIDVTKSCESDGGKIAGKATTYAPSNSGGPNYLFVSLVNSLGEALGEAGGVSPLYFSFEKLPDDVYELTATDDSDEPPAERRYVVSCQASPPAPGPGNGCDLVITAATSTPNSVPGADETTYTANGTITATAATSSPPLQYSFDGVDYSILQRGQSGVPYQVQPFGLTGSSSGFAAATYRLYVKDAAGCVANTTVSVGNATACEIQGEVVTDEDAAYFQPLGAGQLEYDWTGAGDWSALPYWSSFAPGLHTVRARELAAPDCFADFDFVVQPYPRPLKCCFYALVAGARWSPIGEPIGLDAQELTMKRDKLHGVSFEYAERPLGFDCEAGRDIVQAQRDQFGDDAEIDFVEFQRNDSFASGLEVAYRGRLNLYDYTDQDEKVSANAQSSNLATLLATRIKTAANLFGDKDLDGALLTQTARRAVSTTLHSKTLVKVGEYAADGSYGDSGTVGDKNGQREPFIVLGFNSPVVENLGDFYQQASGFSFLQERYEFHKAKEAGDIKFDFKVDARATIHLTKGLFREVFCELYFQKNDETPERLVYIHADGLRPCIPGLDPNCDPFAPQFDSDDYGNGYRANGSRQLTLAVGDKLYLYGKLFVEDYNDGSEFAFGILLDKSSFVRVTAETVGPETIAPMFPVFEALDRSLEIATGKPGLLRSKFYGRRNSQPLRYDQDGAGSRFVLGSGFMIRGIAGKPFAPSFQDLLDGLGPIHNIGLAVQPDPVTGDDVVRIEAAEDFYENVLAYRLDACEKFVLKTDPTRQPNLVNIGYEKWQPEGRVENALDEPNSSRQFATPTKYNPLTYTQRSKFIGGAYLLESQRRLGRSDTDGPNDNDSFVIAVQTSEIAKPVIGWTFYGATQAIVFEYSPKDPIINRGDKVVIDGGPNAGAYTVTLVQPDNSGAFGVPAATSLQVAEPLPAPGAPYGALVTVGEGFAAERDEAFAKVEGIYSPSTAYNLRITPARMLRRHGLFLNAGGKGKRPTDQYRNTYGEGNLKLITRLAGETKDVGESADVQRQDLADLAATPFLPEILSFVGYLDREGFAGLRQRRHGYIAVFDGKAWYTGFILSVKWKRAKNKGTFQLLRRAATFDPTTPNGLLEFNETEFNQPEFN